jgi:hypothetical protein
VLQGQERAFLFKEAAASVADLLGEDRVKNIVGSSSFDAVQVASFPSPDFLSFAAETYLRYAANIRRYDFKAIIGRCLFQLSSFHDFTTRPTLAFCRDSVFLSGALDGLPNGDVIVIIR